MIVYYYKAVKDLEVKNSFTKSLDNIVFLADKKEEFSIPRTDKTWKKRCEKGIRI